MPLTEDRIFRCRPREKPYKLYDRFGLYMIVRPNGGRWWRLKYRFEGKEKLLALGTYPKVRLSEARQLGHHAREKLAAGIDPGRPRRPSIPLPF